MPENTVTAANSDDELQCPAFTGCVFCYSAEFVAYAIRKTIR
jgi:hypothetical protein